MSKLLVTMLAFLIICVPACTQQTVESPDIHSKYVAIPPHVIEIFSLMPIKPDPVNGWTPELCDAANEWLAANVKGKRIHVHGKVHGIYFDRPPGEVVRLYADLPDDTHAIALVSSDVTDIGPTDFKKTAPEPGKLMRASGIVEDIRISPRTGDSNRCAMGIILRDNMLETAGTWAQLNLADPTFIPVSQRERSADDLEYPPATKKREYGGRHPIIGAALKALPEEIGSGVISFENPAAQRLIAPFRRFGPGAIYGEWFVADAYGADVAVFSLDDKTGRVDSITVGWLDPQPALVEEVEGKLASYNNFNPSGGGYFLYWYPTTARFQITKVRRGSELKQMLLTARLTDEDATPADVIKIFELMPIKPDAVNGWTETTLADANKWLSEHVRGQRINLSGSYNSISPAPNAAKESGYTFGFMAHGFEEARLNRIFLRIYNLDLDDVETLRDARFVECSARIDNIELREASGGRCKLDIVFSHPGPPSM